MWTRPPESGDVPELLAGTRTAQMKPSAVLAQMFCLAAHLFVACSRSSLAARLRGRGRGLRGDGQSGSHTRSSWPHASVRRLTCISQLFLHLGCFRTSSPFTGCLLSPRTSDLSLRPGFNTRPATSTMWPSHHRDPAGTNIFSSRLDE